MSGTIHLEIVTPAAIAIDVHDAVSVRARDASGSFGLRPGHADLLTVIPASVISWREASGHSAYCAVRGGVLTMSGGDTLSIACREALPGQHLVDLEQRIVAQQERAEDEDKAARVAQMHLHARAVRQLMHYFAPHMATGRAADLPALFESEEGQ